MVGTKNVAILTTNFNAFQLIAQLCLFILKYFIVVYHYQINERGNAMLKTFHCQWHFEM